MSNQYGNQLMSSAASNIGGFANHNNANANTPSNMQSFSHHQSSHHHPGSGSSTTSHHSLGGIHHLPNSGIGGSSGHILSGAGMYSSMHHHSGNLSHHQGNVGGLTPLKRTPLPILTSSRGNDQVCRQIFEIEP